MTSDRRAGFTHDRRFCALVATFASPRRGEATALRRCDLDLDAHMRRDRPGNLRGPPKPKWSRP